MFIPLLTALKEPQQSLAQTAWFSSSGPAFRVTPKTFAGISGSAPGPYLPLHHRRWVS